MTLFPQYQTTFLGTFCTLTSFLPSSMHVEDVRVCFTFYNFFLKKIILSHLIFRYSTFQRKNYSGWINFPQNNPWLEFGGDPGRDEQIILNCWKLIFLCFFFRVKRTSSESSNPSRWFETDGNRKGLSPDLTLSDEPLLRQEPFLANGFDPSEEYILFSIMTFSHEDQTCVQ